MPWTRHVRAGRDLLRRAFEAANKIGDLTFAAYCVQPPEHEPSRGGRSARRGATRSRAWPRVCAEGAVRPRHRHHRHAARADPDAPRLDADIRLPSTMSSSTSFGFERRFARQPGSGACRVLVLDPQAAGALLCRRLRGGPRGLVEGATAAVDVAVTFRRRRNITSTARCPAPPPATPRRPTSGSSISRLWPRTTGSSRSGRRIARRISRTAPRWSAPRSPASRAASSTPMRLYEQAIRSARANGFIHNEALANELAARFYAARGFEQIAHALSAERPLLLSALGRRRQGAATRRDVSAPQGGRASARSDEHDRGAGRTPRPRDRDQGVAGRLGRDRPGEADRHAHAHGDRAGGRRARSVDSSARG